MYVEIISSWDSALGHIVSARTGHTSPGSQLLSSGSDHCPLLTPLYFFSYIRNGVLFTYIFCPTLPKLTWMDVFEKKLKETYLNDHAWHECLCSFFHFQAFIFSFLQFLPIQLQHSRVCILRGVRYCKCRLLVMLWGPRPVWTTEYEAAIKR